MRVHVEYDQRHKVSALVFHRDEGVAEEKAMEGLLYLNTIALEGRKPLFRQGSGDGSGKLPWCVRFSQDP